MFAALELGLDYSCRSHRMNVITTYTRGDHPGIDHDSIRAAERFLLHDADSN